MLKKSILIALTLFVLSCKKDEKKDCEINNYGTVLISNSSSNDYDIYLDDVLKFRIKGGTVNSSLKVPQGNNKKLFAKQVDGYVLYPTEKTLVTNILSCSDYSWQIP